MLGVHTTGKLLHLPSYVTSRAGCFAENAKVIELHTSDGWQLVDDAIEEEVHRPVTDEGQTLLFLPTSSSSPTRDFILLVPRVTRGAISRTTTRSATPCSLS